MASIPSSGSLMATHNYHRRRLSSTSSNSSCSSSEYAGEVIPHHPGLPKSDPGQWWASFFFGKTNHPAMTTVSESPERALPVGNLACGLVPGAGRKRHATALPFPSPQSCLQMYVLLRGKTRQQPSSNSYTSLLLFLNATMAFLCRFGNTRLLTLYNDY
uniref:Pancreatic progenitor cell differentiation and proliferation factor n=1 Tax=Coturnix japonica TaxID=93934 RepID=A0A8C2SS78_COTJA